METEQQIEPNNPKFHELTWVDWYTSEGAGKFFVKINASYLSDPFNLYGLRQQVDDFRYALEMIRGKYRPPGHQPKEWPANLQHNAQKLYGLLHARFLQTVEALEMMKEKYTQNQDVMEICPKVGCRSCMLPIGISDELKKHSLMMYCPRCNDVYKPTHKECEIIDGAYFGQSWIHFYLCQFPNTNVIPPQTPIPRLFGFRIENTNRKPPKH